MLPPLTRRQIARLPRSRCRTTTPAGSTRPRRRRSPTTCATGPASLALSLVELGEDGAGTERQLHRWRFHPALASEATAWALDRHAPRPDDTAA